MATLASEDRSLAPSPAVAPPPGNPRFPLIDSVRALAVLAVLLYHVAALTGDLGRPVIGDLIAVAGVQALAMFFFNSAFLLYRPFVRARAAGRPMPSVRKYVRRRMLRILPGYWVALTLLAIFPGVLGVFTGDWWRYYFFLQLYSHHTLNIGIPVAWTLCTEITFYLALPAWAALMRRLPPIRGSWLRTELTMLALLGLFGAAVQIAASRLIVSDILADSLLGESTWFALGMTMAVVSVWLSQQREEPRLVRAIGRRPTLCWLGAAACLGATAAILHPGGLFKIVLSLSQKQAYPRTIADIALTAGLCLCVFAPAIFGDFTRGLPRRLLGWRPLMWLGLVSYAFYLYHLAVVSLLAEPSDPGHFKAAGLGLLAHIHHLAMPLLFAMTLVATAALAALSYYFVELPFLRRKER